jgi:hypothetical protein
MTASGLQFSAGCRTRYRRLGRKSGANAAGVGKQCRAVWELSRVRCPRCSVPSPACRQLERFIQRQRLFQAGESMTPCLFYARENGSMLLPDLVHLGLWKQVVERFQQADVVDRFAE